jgi:hypothetical protein
VHPKFAGVGTVDQMLFSPGTDAALELVRPPEVLRSGVVNLSYRPVSRRE